MCGHVFSVGCTTPGLFFVAHVGVATRRGGSVMVYFMLVYILVGTILFPAFCRFLQNSIWTSYEKVMPVYVLAFIIV